MTWNMSLCILTHQLYNWLIPEKSHRVCFTRNCVILIKMALCKNPRNMAIIGSHGSQIVWSWMRSSHQENTTNKLSTSPSIVLEFLFLSIIFIHIFTAYFLKSLTKVISLSFYLLSHTIQYHMHCGNIKNQLISWLVSIILHPSTLRNS